jgi:hypothetical protein
MAESRLADIYRKELKTKGLLGALVSASGARLKEKTDIRGLLPQTGVSGAAFEKMFGKRYKYGGDKQAVRSSGGSDSAATKLMEEKLTRIGVDGKLTAKNTVVLPAMARDMNLMRMNMQKMVGLSGGTPSTKSDMFFKRASDRETQYEEQFKRNSGGLTPTPVGGQKEGGGGFLSTILDFFKGGLGNIVDTLLGALIKGGLIAGFLVALGKYFNEQGFRDSVNSMLDTIFKTVFGDDYKKNLQTGAAILAGAYIAFKASLALLEAAIFAAARRISMLGGGPGLPDVPGGPDKGKGKGGFFNKLKNIGSKAGKYGLYGMGAYGAYEGYNAVFGDDNAVSNGTDGVPTDSVSKKNLGLNTDTALAVGGTALGAAGLAYSASKLTKTLTPTAAKPGFLMTAEEKIQSRAATQAKASSRWGRFLAFVAKKSPALFARLGVKLAGMAGMAAIPIAGWVSALFTLAFAISDIYAIYSLWCEFTSTDEETANPDVNAASTSPTPVAADPTSVSPEGGDTTSTPMAAAASKVTPGGATPTSPTKTSTDTSSTVKTFASLTREQQDAVMIEQRKREGFYPGKDGKPGSLSYDLNNPGNMLYTDFAARYGGMPDTTGRGTGDVKGKFARFPTLQQGVEAQRALWLSPKYANLPLDQAINRWTTGKIEGTGDPGVENYKASVIAAAGGTYTPGTSLASASASGPSQQAGSPSTGNALTDLFAEYSTFRDNYMKQNGGTSTTVNAPVTNVSQSSGGGSNNTSPYNNDMMRYLLRPVT